MKKKECAAKKKERLTKLYALIGFLLSPYPKSSSFLLLYFVPAPMLTFVPTPLSTPMPALISRCLVIYLLLFLILNPPLFYYLIVYPLRLHLQLFSCLIILLFLIVEFQLFYCFLCLVYLFFLHLHLLEYSNNLCQMSFGPAYQLVLQNFFVCSRLLVHTI